jgi:ribosomal protein S18 acetylase RimI-like enzyme
MAGRNRLAQAAVPSAIEHNLFDCFDAIGRRRPEAAYEKGGRWTRMVSGVNHPLCNAIMQPRLEGERAGEQAEEAMAPFKERGLPMLWWLGPSARPEGLASVLAESGFCLAATAAGMAMELDEAPETAIPAGFDVRRVASARERAHWRMVFGRVFELPEPAAAFFGEAFDAMLDRGDPRLLQLVGYRDGDPVACGTFFLSAGNGGIYNMGTLPEARGLRAATALTWAGMAWMREAGARLAVLHASAMARNLYERLGFKRYCDFHLYMGGGARHG